MRKAQAVLVGSIAILLVTLSSAVIFAQEATATVVPPPSFTDGRINDSTLLGGLAIYCVDANSNPTNTFANGGITVWGVGDQKYIDLSAAQLAGTMEVPQQPSVAEMQVMEMEGTPMMTEEPMGTATMEPMMEVTAEVQVMGNLPVLLARAFTPTGDIGFFKLSDNEFALQGYDTEGRLFTYTWTGCTQGTVVRDGDPYLSSIKPAPVMMMTEEPMDMMATPEATVEAMGS